MGKWAIIPLLALLSAASPARSGEFRLGVGAYNLAGETGFSLSYRPDQSHWQFPKWRALPVDAFLFADRGISHQT